MINEGHLERHIKRTQSVYERRRAATILALTTLFKNRLSISSRSAGLHLLVTFPPDFQPTKIERSAAVAGIPLASSSAWYATDAPPREYIIGFAHANETEIAERIARFATELEQKPDVLETVAPAPQVSILPALNAN